jgi:hypothetical protein
MIFPRQLLPTPIPGLRDPGPALSLPPARLDLDLGLILVHDLDTGRYLGLCETWFDVEEWARRQRPGTAYTAVELAPEVLAGDLEPAVQSLIDVDEGGKLRIVHS